MLNLNPSDLQSFTPEFKMSFFEPELAGNFEPFLMADPAEVRGSKHKNILLYFILCHFY
jgi:hypothetical protein